MSDLPPRGLPVVRERLDSWKEIAAYLNRGVRTVQRWEQIAGLPIHRHPHEKRGGVYAYRADLDAWWDQGGHRLSNEPELTSSSVILHSIWNRRLVTGALAATAGVALAWWAISRPSDPIQRAAKVVPLTTYPGVESYPAFSPDGGSIAFSWQQDEEISSSVYTLVIGSSAAPRRLARDATRPAWSPDGRFVSYYRGPAEAFEGGLFVMPASGGLERNIASVAAPRFLQGPYQSWTPDGKWILVPDRASPSRPYELAAIPVAGGGRRRVTSPPSQSYGDSAPAISSDGRTLAFIRSIGMGTGDVFCQRLDLQFDQVPVPRPVTRVGWRMGDLFWAADKRHLLFTGDRGEIKRLWKVPVDRSAPPASVGLIAAIGQHLVASPKGDRLAYTDLRRNLNLWRQNLPQKGERTPPPVHLLSTTRTDANPRISPDGTRIAFASDRTGSFEIWVADIDGGNPRHLTSLGSYSGTPRWSPDSSRIAFDTRVNGNADVYVVSSEGGIPVPITNQPSDEFVPSWSRDGKWIYFISNRSGVNQLWKSLSTGGAAIQLTRGGAADGLESPDGKFVYFARSFSSTSVWRVPANGGQEEEVFDGLVYPLNFEVASSGIYYLQTPIAGDTARKLVFYSFHRRRTEICARIEKDLDNGLALSPDGKWCAFAARGPVSGDIMMIENFR